MGAAAPAPARTDVARRPQGERGSGTVLALAMVMVLCLLATSAAVLSSAVVASHRARSAADLAALAAATSWLDGISAGSTCATAARVAAANGAALSGCAPAGESVTVVVEVRPGLGPIPAAAARARAGPAPDEDAVSP